MELCACGCGQPIRPHRLDKYRDKRFLQGHSSARDAKLGRAHHRYEPTRDEIPSGLCECGCGNRTSIATVTLRPRRHFRGHPTPRLAGHGNAKRGAASHKWKGGRFINAAGYVAIYAPDHPAAIKGYVLEHRLVMEGVLGRPLTSDDHVHHINSVKADNRPENLGVLTPSAHALLHDKAGQMRGAQDHEQHRRAGKKGAAARWQ